MKNVPKSTPSVAARIDHHSDKPSAGPVKPSATEKKLQLPMKNSGVTRHALPCRSLSGIQSMDLVSTSDDPLGAAVSASAAGSFLAVVTGMLLSCWGWGGSRSRRCEIGSGTPLELLGVRTIQRRRWFRAALPARWRLRTEQ